MTDSNGIATLTGVATSAPPGTYPGSVFAVFVADPDYTGSSDTGDLVVS